MAKDGRKLELYEILAAKRAKGKTPLGLDPEAKTAGQAGEADRAPEKTPERADEATDAPGVIIDDSLGEEFVERRRAEARPEADAPAQPEPTPSAQPEARRGYIPVPPDPPAPERMELRARRHTEKLHEPLPPQAEPPPEPEPRPRSPRELVIALDTGLIFFTVVLALLGCSYFIGYKRGQEERPAGLAGAAEIETADPNRLNLRTLAPAPRSAIRPPEQDFTLIIRKEAATENDLPERLELELAEAAARGREAAGREIPAFIFRTAGSDPQYILAVGLGQTANDQGLNELLQIYYAMEGVTLSREPAPYRGCRIAPIRELGTPVY